MYIYIYIFIYLYERVAFLVCSMSVQKRTWAHPGPKVSHRGPIFFFAWAAGQPRGRAARPNLRPGAWAAPPLETRKAILSNKKCRVPKFSTT